MSYAPPEVASIEAEFEYTHPDGTRYRAPPCWKEIETAPQHYEHDLLVYDPALRVSGPMFVGCFNGQDWVLSADGRTVINPTYWMPLPQAPV